MPLYRGSRRLILNRHVVVAAGLAFDPVDLGTSLTLSLGNLRATFVSGSNQIAHAATSHSSGKYYCEFTLGSAPTSGADGVGLMSVGNGVNGTFLGNGGSAAAAYNSGSYTGAVTGTTTCPVVGPATANHVFGLAVDIDNRTMWIKDVTAAGNWNANGTADPATNTNGAILGSTMVSGSVQPAVTTGNFITANFGGSAYAGTPPSGFSNW